MASNPGTAEGAAANPSPQTPPSPTSVPLPPPPPVTITMPESIRDIVNGTTKFVPMHPLLRVPPQGDTSTAEAAKPKSKYAQAYLEAVEPFKAEDYAVCLKMVDDNLTGPTLPRYSQVKNHMLYVDASGEWYPAERHRKRAEHIWTEARDLTPPEAKAELATLAILRQGLNKQLYSQRFEHAPGEVYEPRTEWGWDSDAEHSSSSDDYGEYDFEDEGEDTDEEEDKNEESRLAGAKRVEQEAKSAEEAKAIEETRLAKEAKLAQELKAAEEARLAQEVKAAEEARLVEEAKVAEQAKVAAEEARLAEETRLAEEARLAAEEARLAGAKKNRGEAASATTTRRG